MNSKKGAASIDMILILLIISLILISFLIVLFQYKGFSIDDKKLETQVIIHKLIANKCFSENYATIHMDNFNQNSIDKCLGELDENTFIRVKLKEDTNTYFYKNKENEFLQKRNFCNENIKSNLLCTSLFYPVTIIENNAIKTDIISIQIIV